MKIVTIVLAGLLTAAPLATCYAADDSKVKPGTDRVESGAKKIGEGVKETAKGVGTTVVEGAKYTGEKLKESGKAAEPEAKSAWSHVTEGATAFGHSVKNFFTRLFE